MKIGAHESVSGGMHRAIERATQDGCESVQVFVKNQKRWTQRAWTDEEAATFRTAYEDSDLEGLMAHAGYLINLCTDKPDTLHKAKLALADELTRCAQLGVPYLVMHPGSHVGQGEEVGLERIARNLAYTSSK
ncbi:MAG: TIM barrel protein, partial [Myxococcota bacterium]